MTNIRQEYAEIGTYIPDSVAADPPAWLYEAIWHKSAITSYQRNLSMAVDVAIKEAVAKYDWR